MSLPYGDFTAHLGGLRVNVTPTARIRQAVRAAGFDAIEIWGWQDKDVDRLARLVSLLGVWRGQGALAMFRSAASLAVAAWLLDHTDWVDAPVEGLGVGEPLGAERCIQVGRDISGFAERTKAMNPNVRRKSASPVMINRRFSSNQFMISDLQLINAQALNPPRITSPNNNPPMSFCAMPSEANNQKTYPQISKPNARANTYPRSVRAGKR